MLTSHERRERRKDLFKFIRRTIVLRYLLTPLILTSWNYNYYGLWRETYVFGIRLMGVRI